MIFHILHENSVHIYFPNSPKLFHIHSTQHKNTGHSAIGWSSWVLHCEPVGPRPCSRWPRSGRRLTFLHLSAARRAPTEQGLSQNRGTHSPGQKSRFKKKKKEEEAKNGHSDEWCKCLHSCFCDQRTDQVACRAP